jgi:hypothetical protein
MAQNRKMSRPVEPEQMGIGWKSGRLTRWQRNCEEGA